MSFQHLFQVRIPLISVACFLIGCASITYGVTRWLVTTHIIEDQVARIVNYVKSENIEIVSVKFSDDRSVLSKSPKPTSDILSRINRPGYPDYWRPGALMMGVFGVFFICCGCYSAVRASGDISKSVHENVRFVLAALILCGILFALGVLVISRILFSTIEVHAFEEEQLVHCDI